MRVNGLRKAKNRKRFEPNTAFLNTNAFYTVGLFFASQAKSCLENSGTYEPNFTELHQRRQSF